MDKVLAALRLKRITCFPVMYTTADQKYMQRSTFEDGVYFIEADLFRMTSKVGLLRMHVEKLGKYLWQMNFPCSRCAPKKRALVQAGVSALKRSRTVSELILSRASDQPFESMTERHVF